MTADLLTACFVIGGAIAVGTGMTVRALGIQQSWAPSITQDAANAAFFLAIFGALSWPAVRKNPRVIVAAWLVAASLANAIMHYAHTTLAVLRS